MQTKSELNKKFIMSFLANSKKEVEFHNSLFVYIYIIVSQGVRKAKQIRQILFSQIQPLNRKIGAGPIRHQYGTARISGICDAQCLIRRRLLIQTDYPIVGTHYRQTPSRRCKRSGNASGN